MTQVTVVCPVRDGERYLAPAIESVLAQEPRPHVIVVDDGSLDASAEVAASFGEDVTVRRRPARGISAAWNAGIRAVRSPLVGFIDADDLWAPGRLARQLAAMHEDLDIVLGHVEQFVSPDLDPVQAARLEGNVPRVPGFVAGAMLARRDVFDRVGLFDEDLPTGQVIDWWSRAGSTLSVLMTDDVVLHRRIHGDNFTLRHTRLHNDYARVLKAHLDRTRAVGP